MDLSGRRCKIIDSELADEIEMLVTKEMLMGWELAGPIQAMTREENGRPKMAFFATLTRKKG